jgi:hypothetical protein
MLLVQKNNIAKKVRPKKKELSIKNSLNWQIKTLL